MKRNTTFTFLMACVTGFGLVTGCSDPEYPAPVPATGPPTEAAKILIINAAPDAPALQGLLNNDNAGASLNVGSNSGYIASQVGAVNITAKASTGNIGGTLGASTIPSLRPTLANALFYTVIVTDTINRAKTTGTDIGGPRLVQLTDPIATTVLAAGKSGVRIFNLAPGTPSLFVTIGAVYSSSGLAYRTTTAAFTSVTSGTYTVAVHTGSAAGPIIASSSNVVLGDGKLFTMFVTGKVTKQGNQNIAVGVAPHN